MKNCGVIFLNKAIFNLNKIFDNQLCFRRIFDKKKKLNTFISS